MTILNETIKTIGKTALAIGTDFFTVIQQLNLNIYFYYPCSYCCSTIIYRSKDFQLEKPKECF